jgi:hypothetical protein
VAQDKVIGQCYTRNRDQEFLIFFKRLNVEFPAETKLDLMMNNYSTHKHTNVPDWLQQYTRSTSQFIPTNSNWLNLIKLGLRELPGRKICRGVFFSVTDIAVAIEDHLIAWNENLKLFVRTAAAESIWRNSSAVSKRWKRSNRATRHYNVRIRQENLFMSLIKDAFRGV